MEASGRKFISSNILQHKMKIGAATLFLGLSVFLHSIDLISSQPDRAEPTSLTDLFPESNGIHFPDIEEINHEAAHSFPKFQILNGHHMFHEALTYLKRGNVIFGYKDGEYIELLGALFYEPLLAVFDTKNQQWYTLQFSELKRLGVSRNLKLVRAHDEAHADLHNLHHQANPLAHNVASELAYRAAKNHEGTQIDLHKLGVKSLEDGAQSVKEEYDRAYGQAYETYQHHIAGPSRGG